MPPIPSLPSRPIRGRTQGGGIDLVLGNAALIETGERAGPGWWTAPLRPTRHPVRVGLLVAGLVALLCVRSVSDPDTGWMVATGNLVLHGHFPRREQWSWTAPGVSYIAHEWGSATVMAALVRVFGFRGGLAVWEWAALTAAFGMLAWQALRAGYHAVATAGGAALLALAGMLIWLPRGLLASVPFLVAESWWWRRANSGQVRRAPWFELVALQALWVNLHAMSVLGPVMPLGFAAVGLVAERTRLRGAAETPVPVRALLRRGGWRLVGQFATPYGLAGALHAVVVVTRSTGSIAEYQSPDFHNLNAVITVVLVLLALVWLARGDQPRQALVVAGLLLLGLFGARYLLVTVVFCAPAWLQATQAVLSGDPEVAGVPASPALRGRWAARAHRPGPVYQGLLQLVRRPFLPAVLVVLGLAGGLVTTVDTAREPLQAVYFATGATRWLAGHPDPDRPLFAPYAAGGWLVYEATEHRVDGQLGWRVAWDGRNDIYPTAVFDADLAVSEGLPGWQRVLEAAAGITVLAPRGSPLSELVATHPGWRLAYQDAVWQVWVPDVPTTRPLPDLRALRVGVDGIQAQAATPPR